MRSVALAFLLALAIPGSLGCETTRHSHGHWGGSSSAPQHSSSSGSHQSWPAPAPSPSSHVSRPAPSAPSPSHTSRPAPPPPAPTAHTARPAPADRADADEAGPDPTDELMAEPSGGDPDQEGGYEPPQRTDWGRGYHSIWPRQRNARGPQVGTFSIQARGGSTSHGTSGGVGALLEIERWGGELSIDAFEAGSFDSPSPAIFMTTHLSYALFLEHAYRVGLDAGASFISVRRSSDESETTTAALDVGLSGHAGIYGPLGVEGHLHLSPNPIRAADVGASLVFRLSGWAFSVGWRGVRTGATTLAPSLQFQGPYLGVATILF